MKYVTVPRASSFLPLYPIFTISYGAIFYNTYPDLNQLIWLLPMILWVIIMFRYNIITKILNSIKKEV
jgi:drug/metabolite transporter (DMT)-like permease